jgi:hypothetical protein
MEELQKEQHQPQQASQELHLNPILGAIIIARIMMCSKRTVKVV